MKLHVEMMTGATYDFDDADYKIGPGGELVVTHDETTSIYGPSAWFVVQHAGTKRSRGLLN